MKERCEKNSQRMEGKKIIEGSDKQKRWTRQRTQRRVIGEKRGGKT